MDTVQEVSVPTWAEPTHPKLLAEHAIFLERFQELFEQYSGRYVAIHNGEVIADGSSEIETLTAAHVAVPGEYVLVRRVSSVPEPIQRLPVLRPAIAS